MFKTISFLIILFYYPSISKSQPPIKPEFDWIKITPYERYDDFEWTVLPAALTKEMTVSLLQYSEFNSRDPITVLHLDGEILALLPCRFDVLKWSENGWINLYQGTYAGFNCNSHFFIKNEILYTYGTYGFWKNHSELLYFDFEMGEWQNVQVDNIPQDYGGNASFISGSNLLSILGNHINQSAKKYSYEPNGYYLNFIEKKWSKLRIDLPNMELRDNKDIVYFDLKDFGLVIYYRYLAADGALLLDKSDLSIKFYKKLIDRRDSSFLIAVGNQNKIDVYFKNSPRISLDLDQEIKKFDPVGKVILEDSKEAIPDSTEFDWTKSSLAFLGFSILIFAIIWLSRKKIRMKTFSIWKKNLRKKTKPKLKELNLIPKILPFGGKELTGEQFDEILDLHLIHNLDTRRVMRSKIIKVINDQYLNKNGIELITRIKSNEDKRIISYSINGIKIIEPPK